MKRNIHYWTRFGAVTTISAAATVALLNIGAAFAANILARDPVLVKAPSYVSTATADVVGKPSLHNKVMDEPTGAEPMDSLTKTENQGSPPAGNEAQEITEGATSMLWPAYKYIPQLSNAASG